MLKLTEKRKEKLANEILTLLKEYDLNGDVNIYFNEKCLTGNDEIAEGQRGSDYFNHATDDTISMTFEGSLYEVLNYRYESLANVFIPKFTKLLNSYGLFYEQGHEWNLGTYYHNASDYEEAKEGTDPENPIYIGKSNCPFSLEFIRAEWERRQNEYGDEGSAVVCAGFTFKFKGAFYKMPPQGIWQGSISWEASVNHIKQMLITIGCEDVLYNHGVMN